MSLRVKDRHCAVVITEYGVHGMEATEMQEVGKGTRCHNQMVSEVILSESPL